MHATGVNPGTVVQSINHHKEIDRVPDWPSWGIEEAAAETGYNAEYIRRLCREGKIEYERIGRTYLIKQQSLREYIERLPGEDARYGPRRQGRR